MIRAMALACWLALHALAAVELPAVGVDEHLGGQIPLELRFTDQDGHVVRLADLAQGRPLLLVPGYFRCPMLCGLVLHQVTEAMRRCDWTPGREYAVAAYSFDPGDDAGAASDKRNTVLEAFAHDARFARLAQSWPFLVGGAAEIERLDRALGLRIAHERGEYAHPAAVVVLTPDGRIARYLEGIGWTARDLKLALSDGAEGRIGSLSEHVLLRCWSWDPSTRRYRLAITTVLRGGGASILIAMVIGYLALRGWRRRKRITLSAPSSPTAIGADADIA